MQRSQFLLYETRTRTMESMSKQMRCQTVVKTSSGVPSSQHVQLIGIYFTNKTRLVLGKRLWGGWVGGKDVCFFCFFPLLDQTEAYVEYDLAWMTT